MIRNNTINHYLITYWSDESNMFNLTFTIVHIDLPLMLTINEHLAPSAVYTVEVRADNGGGLSDPSVINVTTSSIGNDKSMSRIFKMFLI